MDYFLLFLVVVLLSSVRLRKNEPGELSSQAFLPIRGICAIAIILHHASQLALWDSSIHYFLSTQLGYLCVSVFFAISGYALAFQYSNNKMYLNGFLKKRLSVLLIPYIIATLLFLLIKILLTWHTGFNIFYFIYFVFIDMFKSGICALPFSWYVEVILLLYVMFYLIYKFFGKNKPLSHLLFIVGITAFSFICIILQYGYWWYNSIAAFMIGIFYFDYSTSERYQRLPEWCGILISLSCLIVFLKLKSINNLILFTELSSCAFAVFIFQLSRAIKFDNKVFDYLGRRSYEIYLCQGFPIEFLESQGVRQPVAFFIITISVTIILAELLYRFTKYLRSIIIKA